MQRVLVIGSGGAGKSTFAKRLGECTGLPVIHLDALFWQPGWVETDRGEWAARVDELLRLDRWIMDGNYSGTLDRRLLAADTVIFLDLPRALCLWRVVVRRIRFRGRSRPDMRENCPERLSWEFLRWIWTYPHARRPRILERLNGIGDGRRVYRLISRAQVEKFLRDACADHDKLMRNDDG